MGDRGPGGGLLTEEGAWALVRALRPGRATARQEGFTLQVDDGAVWRVDAPVTPEASAVLDLFLPLCVHSRWVAGQLGQSLDGYVATESGHSHYVSGPQDIRRLHRLRALADAVVVGAGTATADDPRLTVREVPGDHPVRVVLDPRGRVPPDRRVFRDGAAPTLWVRAERPPGPVPEDVEIVVVAPQPDGGFAPGRVVDALQARGLDRILVEGGGVTVSRFLQHGALDRLHLCVAPLLIGSGRPGIRLPPVATLDEALRPPTRRFDLGPDVLFDLDLKAR